MWKNKIGWIGLCVLLCMLGIITYRPCTALAETEKQVLFISSYSYEWPAVPRQMEGIQKVLEDKAEVSYMFMDTKTVSEKIAVSSLCVKLHAYFSLGKHFDAVIVGDDAALDFIRGYKSIYFSDIPIIYEGIDSVDNAKEASKSPDITGVLEQHNYARTVQYIRGVMPNVKRIVLVVDETVTGEANIEQFKAVESRFPNYQFDILDTEANTKAELAEKLKNYDDNTAAIYSGFSKDKNGQAFSLRQGVQFVISHLDTPLFSADGVSLGYGVLGGDCVDYEHMGSLAAQMVLDILSGASPSGIEQMECTSKYVADYEVMQQYHIVRNKLPRGTELINAGEEISLTQYIQANPLTSFWMLFAIFFVTIVVLTYFRIHDKKQNQKVKRLLKAQEEKNEEMEIITQQAGFICWKFDLETQNAYLYQNAVAVEKGLDIVVEHVPQFLFDRGMIHPDNIQEFQKLHGRVLAGVRMAEGVFRVRLNESSPWLWKKVLYLNRFDEKGHAYEAIGYASDITLEMERVRELEARENLDPLTEVYNTFAFEHIAEEALVDRRGADNYKILCLYNIDHFREINERYGHRDGDMVLHEFASMLKMDSRKTDIVGRYLGNSFTVLYNGVLDPSTFRNKVEKLLKEVDQVQFADGQNLSCSVGMTIYDKEQDTYTSMLHRCEKALVQAKQTGKNQCVQL